MIVHFLSAYYSQWAHQNIAPRDPSYHESYKFCRAVKHGRLHEPLFFPWKKGDELIDTRNPGKARIIFGMYIKKKIFDNGLKDPVIIPVPSKDGLLGSRDFRSYYMLREALQEDRNYPVVPALRFTDSLARASARGPREASSLTPFLTKSGVIPDGDVVLVDDILTSGGTMRAAIAQLSKSNVRVSAAIVCGFTVHSTGIPSFGDSQVRIVPERFQDSQPLNELRDEPDWHWQVDA